MLISILYLINCQIPEDIQKCVEYVQEKFPNWRKNTYYQKRPKTFKMLCELIVRKRYKIVKFLMMKRNNP